MFDYAIVVNDAPNRATPRQVRDHIAAQGGGKLSMKTFLMLPEATRNSFGVYRIQKEYLSPGGNAQFKDYRSQGLVFSNNIVTETFSAVLKQVPELKEMLANLVRKQHDTAMAAALEANIQGLKTAYDTAAADNWVRRKNLLDALDAASSVAALKAVYDVIDTGWTI